MFQLDGQVAAAMTPVFAAAGDAPPPARGDVKSRRDGVEALLGFFDGQLPTPADVRRTSFETTADDGATIALTWYTKDGSTPGSASLYLHGGGMILGSVAVYDGTIARYVSGSGVPMLAVEYRYAPEHPHPVPVEDCYAALVWLAGHAAELGVDPARIAVTGDSGGGGLAAALALVARDRGGPALSRQVLIYPMLDDRTVEPDAALVPFATWSYDDNATGWGALLGDSAGGADVPSHAAPARAEDLTGLPPTYIEVGELDIFRDEDIEFGRRLAAAGVPVELHVHPQVPHAFEMFAPLADVSRRSAADRLRALSSI